MVIAAAAALSLLFATVTQGEISDAEIDQALALSKVIYARLAAESNSFIGSGQSPTLLMAAMQAQIPTSTVANIPLSNFRYDVSIVLDGRRHIFRPLPGDIEEKLFRHFRAFIPSKDKLGDKDLVLLDYGNSLGSLISFYKYVRKFMGKEGYTQRVRLVGLVGERDLREATQNIVEALGSSALDDGGTAMLISLPEKSDLRLALARQAYDKYSEFGEFDVYDNQEITFKSSVAYRSLLDKVRTHWVEETIYTHTDDDKNCRLLKARLKDPSAYVPSYQ
jgi:hypothetical protein